MYWVGQLLLVPGNILSSESVVPFATAAGYAWFTFQCHGTERPRKIWFVRFGSQILLGGRVFSHCTAVASLNCLACFWGHHSKPSRAVSQRSPAAPGDSSIILKEYRVQLPSAFVVFLHCTVHCWKFPWAIHNLLNSLERHSLQDMR